MEPFVKVEFPFNLALLGIEEICAVLHCIEKDQISSVDLNDRLRPTHRDIVKEFIGQLKPDLFEWLQMGNHDSYYTKACVQLPSAHLASCSIPTKT